MGIRERVTTVWTHVSSTVLTYSSTCRQKTPVDSDQEASEDNEDEWTYPEKRGSEWSRMQITAHPFITCTFNLSSVSLFLSVFSPANNKKIMKERDKVSMC